MKRLVLILTFILYATVAFGASSRSFDGVNDEISMGNVLDVTTGGFSICAWVKVAEDNTADTWIAKKEDYDAGYPGYFLGQSGAGDAILAYASDGTTSQLALGSTDIDGAWYYICATWFSATDDLYAFANASLEGSDTVGTVGSLSNAQDFKIGETGNDSLDAKGLIAYAGMWNLALSVLYQADLMWQPEIVPGVSLMQGMWPLLGDATEPDISLNNNTGTVTNATTSSDGPPVFFGNGLPL